MPWTKLHVLTLIPTLIIETIIAFSMYKWLNKKSEKIKMIPFKTIAILLTIMEIIKQIVSIKNGYSLYHLPFHFCSLFIFLLPLHAFYKGKYKEKIDLCMLTCGASLLLVMLILPSIIYGETAIKNFTSDYIDCHSVIFHSLVCFYYMLMISVGKYNFNTKKDIKTLIIFFTIYFFIAAPLAQILETNFHNLYECAIPPINDFRIMVVNEIGWIGQFIYVVGMYMVTIGANVLTYILSKKAIKVIKK